MKTEEMQKQIESMMPTPEQIVEHLDRKIEEAKRLYKTANSDQKYVLESLYPQLKESEDDRIRKNIKVALISMEENLADFYSTHHTSQKELLAWLEKQEWSEEDEEMCYKATTVINRLCAEGKDYVWSNSTLNKLFYWLKSLKDKVQPQPKQKWSEEDEMIKKSLINYVYCHGDAGDFTKKEFIAWLERVKVPSVSSNMDKSFINDIKNIINEAPGVFQSDKNRLISWLEKEHIS